MSIQKRRVIPCTAHLPGELKASFSLLSTFSCVTLEMTAGWESSELILVLVKGKVLSQGYYSWLSIVNRETQAPL